LDSPGSDDENTDTLVERQRRKKVIIVEITPALYRPKQSMVVADIPSRSEKFVYPLLSPESKRKQPRKQRARI
jgi:hypothetical protein